MGITTYTASRIKVCTILRKLLSKGNKHFFSSTRVKTNSLLMRCLQLPTYN